MIAQKGNMMRCIITLTGTYPQASEWSPQPEWYVVRIDILITARDYNEKRDGSASEPEAELECTLHTRCEIVMFMLCCD